MIIIVAMLVSTGVFANEARASQFISYKSGAITALGNGNLEISFTVNGTETMTKVGAYAISVYSSSGSLLETFVYTDSGYENLMGYGTFTHTSSIIYSGTSGQSYYAIITCYAENSNGFAKIPYTTNTATA